MTNPNLVDDMFKHKLPKFLIKKMKQFIRPTFLDFIKPRNINKTIKLSYMSPLKKKYVFNGFNYNYTFKTAYKRLFKFSQWGFCPIEKSIVRNGIEVLEFLKTHCKITKNIIYKQISSSNHDMVYYDTEIIDTLPSMTKMRKYLNQNKIPGRSKMTKLEMLNALMKM